VDLGDLIFWLFLAFAGLPRLIEWLKQRQASKAPGAAPAAGSASTGVAPNTQTPVESEAERRPTRRDDYFDEYWQTGWDDEVEPEEDLPPKQVLVAASVPAVVSPRVPVVIAEATIPFTAADQGRELRSKLGLDRRSELQRSILLMTVLGPCRANGPFRVHGDS